MSTRILIDTAHQEETRVAVVDQSGFLTELDFETTTKKTLKGDIYLAKITRVEPSLQAAFVDYGGNRHGFLPFSEIHPDYFRIPVDDRSTEEGATSEKSAQDDASKGSLEQEKKDKVEILGGEAPEEEDEKRDGRRPSLHQRYKIQEVIQRNQIVLVQVSKEERGEKGAAITTYLSLAGRYCVLMPNSPSSGGVSRKISSLNDRKRLRQILDDLDVPQDMSLIIRTAGRERNKAEIKRDGEYLFKLWDKIRAQTLSSVAPALIHEEANLIMRSIRDLYTKDTEDIFVEGEEGYKLAKNFMKELIPSHAKKVQKYEDANKSLFQAQGIEAQIDQLHLPEVRLPSGGSIVINPTEALVAIDINSGRATRERHIEETAVKTNLEAAVEIARQLRLRDLAGLIVIDFIDMEENRNIMAVERRLKEAMQSDRARIQIGSISPFGLMELSRQRLRPSILESSTVKCHYCKGVGVVRSTESHALEILRNIEDLLTQRTITPLKVRTPYHSGFYILNNKRAQLLEIEQRRGVQIQIEPSYEVIPPECEFYDQRGNVIRQPQAAPAQAPRQSGPKKRPTAPAREESSKQGQPKKQQRRPRRKSSAQQQGNTQQGTQQSETPKVASVTPETEPKQPMPVVDESATEAEIKSDNKPEAKTENKPRRRRTNRRGPRRSSAQSKEKDTKDQKSSSSSDMPSPSDSSGAALRADSGEPTLTAGLSNNVTSKQAWWQKMTE